MSGSPEFIFDVTRLDGWFHCQVGAWDVPRGPLGVIGYLPFVPLFWLMPARGVRPFLIVSSLILSYVTLGPAFIAFLLALLGYSYAVTRAFTKKGTVPISPESTGTEGATGIGARLFPGRNGDSSRSSPTLPEPVEPPSRLKLTGAVLLMHAPYAGLLIWPMPPFLPGMGDSVLALTNYLHWAGLAYVHLKAVCTLLDRMEGRLGPIDGINYLAYMLFAPTFKMGPLYRYDHFVAQIDDARENVRIGEGLIRIAIGLVRLGIMLFVLTKQIENDFFDAPQTLKYREVFVSYLCVPLQLYFWLAGYCDIAAGIGRLMGFRVPEQFNGPWFVNNIAEFWKRWSMTLGRWLYDYPFRAMVANRFPYAVCFILTFLYCGLWHGLMGSYVIWGLLQGVGLAVHHLWHRWWVRAKKRNRPVVQLLRRARIVDTPVGWLIAWLMLINYQFLTITLASDLQHAGARFVPVLFGLQP